MTIIFSKAMYEMLQGFPKYKKLKYWLPIAVSMLILIVVFNQIGNINFSNLYSHVEKQFIFLAILAALFQLLVATFRWRVILDKFGLVRRFSYDLKLIMFASLGNQTLPTAIAGDAFRAFIKNDDGRSRVPNAITVLFDKMIAGVTLLILFIFILLMNTGFSWFDRISITWLGVFLATASLIVAIVLYQPFVRKLKYLVQPLVAYFDAEVIGKLTLKDKFVTIIKLFLLGLISNILIVLTMYFCSRAVGIDLPFPKTVLLMTAILIGLQIPMTVGGWGLREYLFLESLRTFDYGDETSVSASILFALVNILIVLPIIFFVYELLAVKRLQ